MRDPVDFTNLRTITEGDRDMENALFAQFFQSFDEELSMLERSLEESASVVWRASAHALKGTSVNLGAIALAELCRKAQDEYQAPASEKSSLLDGIKKEYASVRAFLLKQMG